ncbi:MAG: GAF domain-containing protein [Synechococcales cyanobacterium CRU_2_2]|nr:GAF domain-containing protein [Synechococcales cyanobacterium CRU_2_2]
MSYSARAMEQGTTQDRRLARLSQLLKTLREATEVSALLEATVPFLNREMGYALVWFGLYQSAEDCLLGYEGASPGHKRPLHQERYRLENGSLLEQVFVQRRPLHVPNLGQERQAGKWQAIAQNIGIQGALLFPIHYLDVCYGLVLLGVPEWGMTPQANDIAALSMLCGQLGVALHQVETLKRTRQQKRPEDPLLRLLDQLRTLPSLEAQLQCVLDETHQFIGANRTLIYWLDRPTRTFRPRLARQTQGNSAGVNLAASECERLYQWLKGDRILSISDTDSALQAEISSYLQAQLRVRSLMAAPLGIGENLLGFILVAGVAPHLWSDEEKRYLQGVGQLSTLIAPLAQIDQTIGVGQADQAAIAQLGAAVRQLQDWKNALQDTANYLFQRLGIERLLLVQHQANTASFPIVFQHQADRRKLLNGPLTHLSDLDQILLDDHADGLVIEDWPSDLRLLRWRSQLGDKASVKSLMVCAAMPGYLETGLLIATSEQSRSWSGQDLALVRDLSRQVATLLHQRSLEADMSQLKELHRSLRWGLGALQQETDPERIDRLGVQAIAQLLQAPWVALLDWSARDGKVRFEATHTSDSSWVLAEGLSLDPLTEPLLRLLLRSPGPLVQSVEDLAISTRQWLRFPQLRQVLLLSLVDPTSEVSLGAVLIGDSRRYPWAERSLEFAQLLVQQLAWSRRSVRRILHLQTRQGQLEQLNWYKQFCGERFQLDFSTALNRIQETDGTSLSLSSCQVLKNLNEQVQVMGDVFRQEQWSVQIREQTTPLIRLLKQAKQQLDPVISARQLWCQFHWSEVQQLQIQGDWLKLAGILQSVLVAACDRCLLGGRIDIWCRAQPDQMLEFSITDNGILDPLLLSALQPDADSTDPILQGIWEVNPGLSLRLSQTLLTQLGGNLELLALDDGRTMSRVMIPGLHE